MYIIENRLETNGANLGYNHQAKIKKEDEK